MCYGQANDAIGRVVDIDRVSHLLDRCSTFGESIHLIDINTRDVMRLLEKCSRVKKMVLERIDASLIDYLRDRCGRSEMAALRSGFAYTGQQQSYRFSAVIIQNALALATQASSCPTSKP